jgi:hypothetical protein
VSGPQPIHEPCAAAAPARSNQNLFLARVANPTPPYPTKPEQVHPLQPHCIRSLACLMLIRLLLHSPNFSSGSLSKQSILFSGGQTNSTRRRACVPAGLELDTSLAPRRYKQRRESLNSPPQTARGERGHPSRTPKLKPTQAAGQIEEQQAAARPSIAAHIIISTRSESGHLRGTSCGAGGGAITELRTCNERLVVAPARDDPGARSRRRVRSRGDREDDGGSQL